MTIAEATKLRDEYIKVLVGRSYDVSRPNWSIKDVIVSSRENAGDVYAKMYEHNMSNEEALGFFSINENNYEALIIAHPWPQSSGDIHIEPVQNYITANSI